MKGKDIQMKKDCPAVEQTKEMEENHTTSDNLEAGPVNGEC